MKTLLLVTVLAVFAAALLEGEGGRQGPLPSQHTRVHQADASRTPAPAPAPALIESHAPSDFDSVRVADQYALLIDSEPPRRRALVFQLLSARERVEAGDLQTIAAAERNLSLALSEDEYALYEQLREATPELAELEALSRQLADYAPLSRDQRQALLRAKLQHKQTMQTLVSQLDSVATLPPMERGYARDVALQGLTHHSDAFLEQAREVLDPEQWSVLQRYETEQHRARIEQNDRNATMLAERDEVATP